MTSTPAGSGVARLLRRRVPRLLRLLVASGLATLADAAVLLALCWQLGAPPGPAAVAGALVGGAVNFAIGRAWVFGARDRAWWRQAARYAVVVVGGGAVVSGLAVAALVAAGLLLPVAKAIAVVVVLIAWTYPMSARVVFAPGPRSAAPAGRQPRAATMPSPTAANVPSPIPRRSVP
jgi:putative flippase GtrA